MRDEGYKTGPTYCMVKWIHVQLAVEIGLVVEIYEKVEMTTVDVDYTLKVFWRQARHIRCSRITRVLDYAPYETLIYPLGSR